MAVLKHTKPHRGSSARPRARTSATKADRPDLDTVLWQFANALAIVEVTLLALEAQESRCVVESMALRTGLTALNDVYDAFDLAIGRIGKGEATLISSKILRKNQ